MGYNLYSAILNAKNFGVPQNRERIYIVGFKKSLKISSFHFPKPVEENISLTDILEPNPKDAKIINRTDINIYKLVNPKNNLFGEKEFYNKPIQIGKVNKGGQGERIYHPYGHAITLSAYGGGAGSKTGLYYINGKVRKLSPRECARAQGFPESFILHENHSQSFKQFGNSVSINVLQKIIQEIIYSIDNHMIK